MTAGDAAPIYWDSRDLTPFGNVQLRTPVHELAGGVEDLLTGVFGGRHPALLSVDGDVPRLKRLLPKPAKAVHEAVFTSREPERLPGMGWALLPDGRAPRLQARRLPACL